MSFQPKKSSSINNSVDGGGGAIPDTDEYSQSGGTLGSIAGSSITTRSRYERRGSTSADRARHDVGTSYISPRTFTTVDIDRAFDRQQLANSATGSSAAAAAFRSHRSPLHVFAESLLERTRLAASAATTAVGNAQSQVRNPMDFI